MTRNELAVFDYTGNYGIEQSIRKWIRIFLNEFL